MYSYRYTFHMKNSFWEMGARYFFGPDILFYSSNSVPLYYFTKLSGHVSEFISNMFYKNHVLLIHLWISASVCDFILGYTVLAGVFFVRRSKWSKDFLDRWWNQTSFIQFGSTKSGDNDALKHLITRLTPEEMRDHVRMSPMQCLFNSYPWNLTWKSAFRLISSLQAIWKGYISI